MASTIKRGLRLALSISRRRLAPTTQSSAKETPTMLFTTARALALPSLHLNSFSTSASRSFDDAVCPTAVNPAPLIRLDPKITDFPIASHDDVFAAINKRRTTILDVRTPFEVKTFGKIPNSFLVPYNDIDYAMQLTGEDFKLEYGFYKPDTFAESLIVYCRSGARAKLAAVALRDKYGFRNVKVYEASWMEWEKKHPEDVKKPMPPTVEELMKTMAEAATLKKRRWFGHV